MLRVHSDGKMESGKCGETDCSKPGEVPCEGAYMATSCAKTCGLCDELGLRMPARGGLHLSCTAWAFK